MLDVNAIIYLKYARIYIYIYLKIIFYYTYIHTYIYIYICFNIYVFFPLLIN